MKTKLTSLILLFATGLTWLSCDSGPWSSDNRKTDSLFLGISLGMDRKAFYDYCWEQNKKKVFTHGPTNLNVEYKLVNELKDPVSMRFYPTFYEDKIYEMPVTFTYEAWAPWNKEYWADSLLVQMLPVFEKWYGDGFKKADHPRLGPVYYKIDGTRRINLFRRDDQFVQAVFTDLEAERKLKKIHKERTESEETP
jgi:hypothetical protein